MNELVDLLRFLGRGWWVVATVAVLAGVIAGLTAPDEAAFRTEAVVGVDPTTEAANARLDFVRNLEAAAGNPVVLEELAADVDRDPAVLRRGLSVTRLEDSQLTLVTFEEDVQDPDGAELVVTRFPLVAQELLLATDRTDDESLGYLVGLEAETGAALAEADAAVEAILDANGDVPPDLELATTNRRILDLEFEVLAAAAVGDDDAERAAAATLAAVEAQRPPTVALAEEYADVVALRDRLSRRLATIEDRILSQEIAGSDDAAPPAVVVTELAQRVTGSTEVVRRAVSAAALAGLAMLGLLLLRDRSAERARERRRRAMFGAPADAATVVDDDVAGTTGNGTTGNGATGNGQPRRRTSEFTATRG